MESYGAFWVGLSHLLQWQTLVAMLGGTIIGVIIGAIPGIGAGTGMALLLPIIFFWPPEAGLVLLTALWMADNYGGSISSILLGVPGGAGAVFTCLDGFPMAQQGRSAVAIGVAMTASAVGGVFGALVFLGVAPPLSTLAMKFGPAEFFWLAAIGLTIIATTSRGRLGKGLITAAIGVVVGSVGIHVMTGYPRFTFGVTYLMGPIGIVVFILGVFAVAELMPLAAEATKILRAVKVQGNIFEGMRLALRYPVTLLRGSLIGAIVGAIPGIGVATGTAVAYQQTVSSSKHPETFGKGDPEGVAAPESSNNAVQGGSLIPTLLFGIPGSSSAGIFLGAVVIYGFRIGPKVFTEQGPLIWTIWWALIAAVICFIIFGVAFNPLFAKVTQAPLKYLVPIVCVFMVAGAYTVTMSPLDLVAILVFGILTYFLKRQGYPVVPLILGFILGPIAEENLFRALLISHGSWGILFKGIINPILVALFIFPFAMYFRSSWRERRKGVTITDRETEIEED